MLFATSAYEGKVLLGKSVTSALLTLVTQMNNLFIFYQHCHLPAVLWTHQKNKKKKKGVYFSLMNEAVCIQKDISVIWIYYTSPSGIALGGLLHGPYLNTFTSHLCLPSVPSALGYVTGHCRFIAVNLLPSIHHKSLLDCTLVVLL